MRGPLRLPFLVADLGTVAYHDKRHHPLTEVALENHSDRLEFAIGLCRDAGHLARDYFSKRSALVVDRKGAQDWVSVADRNVELFIGYVDAF